MMSVPALLWCSARFDELGVRALYDALQLRCRVFILEQGPYLDPDGCDQASTHLLGRKIQDGPLMAYLRIVDPGVRFAEPSLGRVITAPECRGQGFGKALVREGIQLTRERWPGHDIRISAQAHLADFYGSFGFQVVGEPYGEDSIPHVQMLLRTSHSAVAQESMHSQQEKS